MSGLHSILPNVSFENYSVCDFANSDELKEILNNKRQIQDYFFHYNFSTAYNFDNIADYYLTRKICGMRSFEHLVVDEFKDSCVLLFNYFDSISNKFIIGNIIKFFNFGYDFVIDQDSSNYGLYAKIYIDITKYYNSLDPNTYQRAITSNPYFILNYFEEYAKTFKKYPLLYVAFFNCQNVQKLMQIDLKLFTKVAGKVYVDRNISVEIKNIIMNEIKFKADQIVSNRDLEIALINQFEYKIILSFMKSISYNEYSKYDKAKMSVEYLADEYIEKNGAVASHKIPYDIIKKQGDDNTVNWAIKQIRLTHYYNEKTKKFEHFSCAILNQTSTHLVDLFCSTNININSNFGISKQRALNYYNSVYCEMYKYNVSSKDKSEYFFNNQISFIKTIFDALDIDFKCIETELNVWKMKCQNYFLSNNNEHTNKNIDFSCMDISIKLIEKILKCVYKAEMDIEIKFYDSERLSLGVLLNYNTQSNPLIKSLSVNFMKYLNFCLLIDEDKEKEIAGLNLRNILAHDNFNWDEFDNSNQILSMLILTSVINALFIYYQ